MSSQWFAVYENSTGDLRSVGTEIANPLPPGLASTPLAGRPDPAQPWNKVTHTFDPIPAKGALQQKVARIVGGSGEQFTAVERDRVLAFIASNLT